MIQLNDTTRVNIRPTEPVNGIVRVDFHYSNGEETGIARATAFLRLEDRTFTSPAPHELTSEQLDTLIADYNSAERVKSRYKRHMHVDAGKRDDGTFDIHVECEGFDVDALGAFFDYLEEFSEGGDEATFLTLPVVRELEDPEFMAELDRRLQAIKDGTSKTITLEEFRERLKARISASQEGSEEDSDEEPEAPV